MREELRTCHTIFGFSNLISQIGSRLIVYADANCGRQLAVGTNNDGATSTSLTLFFSQSGTITITARSYDISGTASGCSNAVSYTYVATSPSPVPTPSPSPWPTSSSSPGPYPSASATPSPTPSVTPTSSPVPIPSPSMAVTYQMNPGHSGTASWTPSLIVPAASAWSVNLPDTVSYPLIANGRAYVLVRGPVSGTSGTRLYALNLTTGVILWGPINIPGTYPRAGLAYDAGKIFVINYDGLLSSYDAVTGTAGWSALLPSSSFTTPPTAVNGIVYVGGNGVQYAVNETNGQVLWSTNVAGVSSASAISDDGAFVSYPCQLYKLDPRTGATVWHYNGPCSGGGNATPAYANGSVYVRDWSQNPVGSIFNALTGISSAVFGTMAVPPIPAINATNGFFLIGGTLQKTDLQGKTPAWSFAGDGGLITAPIVVNNSVFVGSSSGMVYSVDATTGAVLWSATSGAAIFGPDEQNVSAPLVGISAGEGYLLVPSGLKLTAWRVIP